jgi:tetratricopeptide (TPR) repeat protein
MSDLHLNGVGPAEARQIDRACDLFEAAWQAGQRPRPEEYLGTAGEPARSALLRQLLLLDWDYRKRAGDSPRADEYHSRFPNDTTLIEDVRDAMTESAASTQVRRDELQARATSWYGAEGVGRIDDPSHAEAGADRYELLQEVGQGGMGVVYRGCDRHLGRELAVKVLQETHRDNADLRRRFTEEARVGSQLQHPAIVPVYELGRFDDGRPYFTMKLVQGHTLAALLGGRANPSQDLPRWLGVFEQVCQAMAYAHARGVIHRDLKPANVMVGTFGEVQVMDWGFAKVLAGDRAAAEGGANASGQTRPVDRRNGLSQSGVLMGTPAYMPPEQARGETACIDKRTDVFALGAILCEILTGRPPHVGRTADEICRRAVGGDLGDAQNRLDACGADLAVRELAKHCLAAAPADRPADAGVVARDLAAYLASAQERLQRAELERAAAEARAQEAAAKAQAERRARRLTLALAAALLVGTGVAAWQAVVATRAKQDALTAAAAQQAAREVAAAKEAETQAILDFVEQRIFAAARPKRLEGGLGPDVRLRAAIEAALPFVEKGFPDQPLIEARLRRTLGNSFRHLGDGKAAAMQFELARAIYLKFQGPNHFDTLATANDLGISYGMDGRIRDSIRLYEELIPLCKTHLGPDAPVTLGAMNNLGMCYFELREYDKGLQVHQEVLAIKRAKLGAGDRSTLRSMANLANIYHGLGRYEEALKLRLETWELQKASFGPVDYDTLMTAHNIGTNYRKLGRHADALRFHEETLARRSDTLGRDHPDTLSSMWSLANDLFNLNRDADALPLLDECLERAVGKRIHANFPEVANLRLRHFEKARDPQGCRATAVMWEKQKRTDAESLYQAAVCRAVTANVLLKTGGLPDATQQAREEADLAMGWLHKAVVAGYKDVASMKQNKDLDALRDRAEFKKLLEELEAGTNDKK